MLSPAGNTSQLDGTSTRQLLAGPANLLVDPTVPRSAIDYLPSLHKHKRMWSIRATTQTAQIELWIWPLLPTHDGQTPRGWTVEEERSRDSGGPVSGVYSVYEFPCCDWNWSMLPLSLIQ